MKKIIYFIYKKWIFHKMKTTEYITIKEGSKLVAVAFNGRVHNLI